MTFRDIFRFISNFRRESEFDIDSWYDSNSFCKISEMQSELTTTLSSYRTSYRSFPENNYILDG